MDLTRFTSRELYALHTGYNADALATIAVLDAMAPRLYELSEQPARSGEYHAYRARYELLLAEAKARQAKGLEVYAEITRRCGMDRDTIVHDCDPAVGTGYCGADEPLTHVDMVCAACRKPVLSTGAEWMHAMVNDARACVRDYPVKAMVAAGNENVARNA